MGRFQEGVLGSFSGKIGPVIGSSWKGIQYMRGKGKIKRNRKVTLAMEIQRAKFKLATSFLRPLKDLLNVTYPGYSNSFTARNAAQSALLNEAITGEYPDLRIEYSLVKMAKGSAAPIIGAKAESTEPGKVTFFWSDSTGMGNAKEKDKAIIIVYSPKYKVSVYSVTDIIRSVKTASLEVPLLSGTEVHTWLSFLSENGVDVCDSQYLGAFNVV